MGTKCSSRPDRIADGQGVLRTYDELLGMLQRQLSDEAAEHRRVMVGDQVGPSLSWRDDRIADVTALVRAIATIAVPFESRGFVVNQLNGIKRRLHVLNWPERVDELTMTIDRVISRLKHTTRRPGVPMKFKRRLMPANQIPPPQHRVTRRRR